MDYGVRENGGVAQVSVARLGGSSGVFQVNLSTSDGTARSGSNYSPISTNLVWNSGSGIVVQTVNVPIIDSGNQSSNLTFKVNLSGATVGGIPYTNFGAYTNALVTITNSDSPGTVEFTSPFYTVNENGGAAIIPLVRTGGSAGNLSVQISTVNGTATNGINFQGGSGTVVFGPGQVNTNIYIGISNQNSPNALTFYVALTNAVPTNGLGSPSLAQVTVNGANSVNQPPGGPDPTYNPTFNGSVLALALQANGQLVAGGGFTMVNGLPRQYIARINTNGTLDTTFSSYVSTAGANAPVEAIAIETNGLILVGGAFTNFNNGSAYHFTRLNVNGSTDTAFNSAVGTAANAPVYAIAQTFVGGQSRIVVAGAFTQFSGNQENSIVQLYDGGGVDPGFNASANATIYAVAVQPNGQILIGGDFTVVDGVAVNHIARLNADGSLDYGFVNAVSNLSGGANGSVRAITLQLDGRILIGGQFTSVDGVPCNYIARLNSNGSLDGGFINALSDSTVGAIAPVNTISVQSDSRIVVGGQFTQFNGVSRNRVTRLNSDGTTDLNINFGTGADGVVDASVIQNDGNIILGGSFLNFDNASHPYLVRLWGRSIVGSGSFGFAVSGEQVGENGILAPITIVRNGGTAGTNADGSGDVYVSVITLTNTGTAVPGVNYTPVNTLVAFPPGEVQETVDVPVLDEVTNVPSQWTVNLLLTNPAPSWLTINALQNTNTLTILNTSSFISFASPVYSVAKDVPGGMANINLTLQGYTNNTSSVVFSTTTNGTASPGVEYTPVPPTTVTFNPGVTNVAVQVPIIDDPSYTGNQTVTMALTNASNAYVIAPTNATLTIVDTVNTPGQVFFAATNYTANVSSGQAVVTVLYTNGDAPISVSYTTVPGTAQPGINYLTTSGVLNFGRGVSSLPISVPLPNYTTPEGPVSFSIILSNAVNGATLIAPTNTTVTILDDVSTGVSFASATNYFQETNGVVAVLVQRSGNMATNFSLSYFTTDGTAVAGVNYQANSGTLNFAPGQTVAGISMTLINNEDVSNLQFGISLVPPANNAVQLISPTNALVVETPAAAGITLASPTNSVFKNGGSITIPVICLNPTNEPPILNSNSIPLTVDFATADGTGQAGVDYVATNGVLTFTNGIATNTITVQILNNNLITGLRTFSVNIFSNTPAPPARLVAPTNDVITIIDSNSGLEFSSANYSIDSGGVVPITVVRLDNTNNTCSVAYATTAGGTAVPNTDYYPTNGALIFLPGQVSNSFNVTVIGSSSVEPDKTILLALSNPTNGVLTAPSAATITIFNQNGSFIVPAGVSMDPNSPLPNGILQSNQLVGLYFGFRDAGGLPVSDLTATLLQSTNITPSPAGETKDYASLTVNGHSRSQSFSLTANGTNGQTIFATFKLNVTASNNTTTVQTNSFALTIGSWTTTWSNTNSISIPGEISSVPMIASPYPSIITVTNVGGVLVGVTATITNFSDTSPQADELLLVSPSLADTLLMAGVGNAQVAASHVTLTFSNCVPPFYLPYTTSTSSPITNGVYNATQYGGITIFP
ncbi:MAG TPA: Calx-beta domain-containing protein [Verrucomicrobiae bacterium]|nr:Calx-beta domain-containing protein [Verrucomicrobiae bacterium]